MYVGAASLNDFVFVLTFQELVAMVSTTGAHKWALYKLKVLCKVTTEPSQFAEIHFCRKLKRKCATEGGAEIHSTTVVLGVALLEPSLVHSTGAVPVATARLVLSPGAVQAGLAFILLIRVLVMVAEFSMINRFSTFDGAEVTPFGAGEEGDGQEAALSPVEHEAGRRVSLVRGFRQSLQVQLLDPAVTSSDLLPPNAAATLTGVLGHYQSQWKEQVTHAGPRTWSTPPKPKWDTHEPTGLGLGAWRGGGGAAMEKVAGA